MTLRKILAHLAQRHGRADREQKDTVSVHDLLGELLSALGFVMVDEGWSALLFNADIENCLAFRAACGLKAGADYVGHGFNQAFDVFLRLREQVPAGDPKGLANLVFGNFFDAVEIYQPDARRLRSSQ